MTSKETWECLDELQNNPHLDLLRYFEEILLLRMMRKRAKIQMYTNCATLFLIYKHKEEKIII